LLVGEALTVFDQNGLLAFAQERRGAIGDSPVLQENQRARNGMRTKYPKDVQESDGYEQATEEGRIKRARCARSVGERG